MGEACSTYGRCKKYELFWKNVEGGDHFGDLNVGGGRYEMDLKEKVLGDVVGFCEHSNNAAGFTEKRGTYWPDKRLLVSQGL
jgi:hypothetical protein